MFLNDFFKQKKAEHSWINIQFKKLDEENIVQVGAEIKEIENKGISRGSTGQKLVLWKD